MGTAFAFSDAMLDQGQVGSHLRQAARLFNGNFGVITADSILSDGFFSPENLGAIDDMLDPGRKNETIYKRVRIAIIDSGVDMTHPTIQLLREAVSWQRLTFCDFVGVKPELPQAQIKDSTSKGIDTIGHGTHITALVMQIAKWSEVFVARVVDDQGNVEAASVCKALQRALDIWDVNIIVMSFGYRQPRREFALQLKRALNKEVLVFAAASNGGASTSHASQTWPANDGRVFGAYSANFWGKESDFNPPEKQSDGFSHFKFLGENVASAWPIGIGHTSATQKGYQRHQSPLQRMSGTSVAAPVAAATAALFIEFVQQNKEEDDELEDLVKSPEGMKDIFNRIGVLKGGHILKFVLPWHLIQVESTQMHIKRQVIITQALNEVKAALYMKRLTGDTIQYPGQLLAALDAIEEQEAQRKKDFEDGSNSLREESQSSLKAAAGQSTFVAGALTVGTLVSGPAMFMTGAFSLSISAWAASMLLWRALAVQRDKADNMFNTAVLRKSQLAEDVAELTTNSARYQSTLNSILENVSVAIGIAEEKTQIRLRMIRCGLKRTQVESLRSTQWNDSRRNLDSGVIHRAYNAHDAMDKSMKQMRSYRGRWMDDIEFLVLCVQSLAAATAKPSTRPTLPKPPSNFSAEVHTIISKMSWYHDWKYMNILQLRPACEDFADRLMLITLDLCDDLERFQTLESQTRRSIHNLRQVKSLTERISKFEQEQAQEERDPETLRREHIRHQKEGEKSWLDWFLRWLGLYT